jgi:hypothetical protein
MDIRKLIEEEIERLQEVLRLLAGGELHPARRGPAKKTAKKTGHRMSAAARKRISAAQKARWAKVRAGKK